MQAIEVIKSVDSNSLSLILILFIICLYVLFWRKEKLDGSGKHVLVTGCDSGFGNLIAYELNALNCIVFASCLTKEAVKKFEEDPLFKGVAIQMDVTKDQDVQNCKDIIAKHTGQKGTNIAFQGKNSTGLLCSGY